MEASSLLRAKAVWYVERFGYSVIPIGVDKKPGIKWAEFQSRKPEFEEVMSWPEFTGLAVVTGEISGIVVVDCDSKDSAKWFTQNVAKSPMICQSKRGYHFYFKYPDVRIQNAVKVQGQYDVRGDGGYILLPPSKHSEGQYEWLRDFGPRPNEILPTFDPAWRPETKPSYEVQDRKIKDGQKYIAKIHSLEGQGGDQQCFKAACALAASGLSEGEALLALQEWNETNAQPKWSNRELLHKIRSAFTCTDEPSL